MPSSNLIFPKLPSNSTLKSLFRAAESRKPSVGSVLILLRVFSAFSKASSLSLLSFFCCSFVRLLTAALELFKTSSLSSKTGFGTTIFASTLSMSSLLCVSSWLMFAPNFSFTRFSDVFLSTCIFSAAAVRAVSDGFGM